MDRSVKTVLFVVLLVFFVSFTILTGVTSVFSEELQEALDARTCLIWIEGQQLGEMIIGARAQMGFILVDSKLKDLVAGNPDAPDWLRWHSSHFGTGPAGRELFIIRYKTFKPWDFDPEKVFINGSQLQREDIVTRKAFTRQGLLPSDVSGTIAVFAPLGNMKQQDNVKLLPLAYGEYSGILEIPLSVGK